MLVFLFVIITIVVADFALKIKLNNMLLVGLALLSTMGVNVQINMAIKHVCECMQAHNMNKIFKIFHPKLSLTMIDNTGSSISLSRTLCFTLWYKVYLQILTVSNLITVATIFHGIFVVVVVV